MGKHHHRHSVEHLMKIIKDIVGPDNRIAFSYPGWEIS